MRKIKVWWETDNIDGGDYTIIEVPDNLKDEIVQQIAEEKAMEHFSWGWH